jgi:predicted HTH domain antitoxin
MWYAFYGETLTSASVFEDRMAALTREIGVRGRADAVTATPGPATTAPQSGLQAELQGMKMRDLLRQAQEAEVHEDAILDSQDAENPKAALIALIVQARRDTADLDSFALRAELEGMRMRELMARARERGIDPEALLDAQDTEQPKAAVVGLLLQREASC